MTTGTLNAEPCYDPVTVWLHWITAALVTVLWLIGQTADSLPRPYGATVWSVHVALGLGLAGVLLTRVAWRTRYGRALPPANPGALRVLARGTHLLLYALLVAVVLTGIANASYRGFSLFGVWSIPQVGTGDRAMRRSINGWHELAANAVLILAAFHAVAALVHHYVWRDPVMRRMALARRAEE